MMGQSARPGQCVFIRAAGPDDLELAKGLLLRAGLPIEALEDQWGEQYAVAVASEGELVGLAGLETYEPYGLLRSVVVAPEWRGFGVAAGLVQDRLTKAGDIGITEVYLLTTTAQDYFARHGFRTVARPVVPPAVRASAEFRSACPASAVVMSTALPAANREEIRSAVRRRYGAAARAVSRTTGGDSHGAVGCCGGSADPITQDLYDALQTEGLPPAALLASLGCGNPTALAELHPGEVVLDLGSGGGIDVLLSAKRVGPSGRAIGLDMTPDMVTLARRNAAEAGVANVEFLRGEIEHIPLPDESVDVVISNCVINLSADKGQVLREAFRVLRPGGRFAVSDIVVQGNMPAALRTDLRLWTECVGGALEETEFRRLLESAGFGAIEIEPTRVYRSEELAAGCCCSPGSPVPQLLSDFDGKIISAFIRARKPTGPSGKS